jgi:rhodanese-related sulfurtransferase
MLNVRKVVLGNGAASVLAVSLLWVSGCRDRVAKPESVTVGQLAAMLKGGDPPRLYDANGDSTRREYGIIPGATLLPSSRDYAVDLLPPVKQSHLVFYCASSWCGAAEKAAERALAEGYTTVSVLPDGIKGWREAGMPTSRPN